MKALGFLGTVVCGSLFVAGCSKDVAPANSNLIAKPGSGSAGSGPLAAPSSGGAPAAGGSMSVGDAGGNTGSTADGTRRSAGCGLTGKPTGELHLKAKDGAGVTRDFQVQVPASYDPAIALAVTLVYHGAGATSADAKSFGIQNAANASASSIFVYPQGVAFESYGVGWNDNCGGYDMPFFDNMLAALEASYCVDPKRVYAAGFSWGCDHVTALACCRGDKIRGIAAASCSDEFKDPANYKTYNNSPCPVTNGAAIRFTHSTTADSGYAAPLFATTTALYRAFNGCGETTTAESPAPCRAFSGCRTAFIDCPYDNLAHQIPDGWAKDTWAFFSTLSQ